MSSSHLDAASILDAAKALTDRALEAALARTALPLEDQAHRDAHLAPERLLEAMRYAALAPGKRLRPALVLCSAEAVGAPWENALSGACAVEMIHAYSLVHDDLPIMDDDDMRRGQPACHKAFGEATALLTGDALLTEAFAVLSDPRPLLGGLPRDAHHRAAAVFELSRAAGAGGMIGGQQDDLAQELNTGGHQTPVETILSIHRRKTGRLICAATALGAHLGGAQPEQVEALRRFGASVGLAFQLVDDLLDADGLSQQLDVRKEARRLTEDGRAALEGFGERAAHLRQIAAAMAERAV